MLLPGFIFGLIILAATPAGARGAGPQQINTDGAGLRQITRGPYHDFNPVYYPDGRIVFCSSRVESYSLYQDFLAAALFFCDGDGGNLRRIDFTSLCTSAPAVLPDGTILCTRWEYQDKNIFSWQGLWSIHPDDRQLKLFFGNTFTINKTYTPQCSACHPPLDGEGRHNRWINLTRPESSRLLNAHLTRPAGGLELAGKEHAPPARIFPDRNDPVYQALWQALEKGKAALLARPRMDMPGAVPIPQERNFGKVY